MSSFFLGNDGPNCLGKSTGTASVRLSGYLSQIPLTYISYSLLSLPLASTQFWIIHWSCAREKSRLFQALRSITGGRRCRFRWYSGIWRILQFRCWNGGWSVEVHVCLLNLNRIKCFNVSFKFADMRKICLINLVSSRDFRKVSVLLLLSGCV